MSTGLDHELSPSVATYPTLRMQIERAIAYLDAEGSDNRARVLLRPWGFDGPALMVFRGDTVEDVLSDGCRMRAWPEGTPKSVHLTLDMDREELFKRLAQSNDE